MTEDVSDRGAGFLRAEDGKLGPVLPERVVVVELALCCELVDTRRRRGFRTSKGM